MWAVGCKETHTINGQQKKRTWRRIYVLLWLGWSLFMSSSKIVVQKTRDLVEEKSREIKGLDETVGQLVKEKGHIGSLLRSALSNRMAMDPSSKGNALFQVAENGLREAGIDFKFSKLLEDRKVPNPNDKVDVPGTEGDEIYSLAGALEKIVKASQLEIIELQHSVDELRAESSLLKEHVEIQAKELDHRMRRIEELEEKERVANVEGLMMDIAAAEEEITRWKVAADEAEAEEATHSETHGPAHMQQTTRTANSTAGPTHTMQHMDKQTNTCCSKEKPTAGPTHTMQSHMQNSFTRTAEMDTAHMQKSAETTRTNHWTAEAENSHAENCKTRKTFGQHSCRTPAHTHMHTCRKLLQQKKRTYMCSNKTTRAARYSRPAKLFTSPFLLFTWKLNVQQLSFLFLYLFFSCGREATAGNQLFNQLKAEASGRSVLNFLSLR